MAEHPGEIIDVDSMSTDTTLAMLRRYGVRVEKDVSCSLGQARQIGVSCSKGKYVMFVDSDVELTKGCIRTLVGELEENGWAAIQARLLSNETGSYWQNVSHWLTGPSQNSCVGPQSSVATAATVFRRELLLNLQFDPNFVEAAEDVDISIRLVRAGHIVGISRNAIVYHDNRREFLPFLRQQIRYGRGTARLAYKYHSAKIPLKGLHYTAIHLLKSFVTGRWNRIPYFVSIMVGNMIGMATFRSGE
jgi:cellulose synthase/poly-beta-1,6-N-acetylglucosamine synthase-like glycosyltransferase